MLINKINLPINVNMGLDKPIEVNKRIPEFVDMPLKSAFLTIREKSELDLAIA
jgi:hypothetical protein